MRHLLFILLSCISLAFCSGCETTTTEAPQGKVGLPERGPDLVLFQPIQLSPGTTTLLLDDFYPFHECNAVGVNPALDARLEPEQGRLNIEVRNADSLPWISTMSMESRGYMRFVLLKKSRKIVHTLRYVPQGEQPETVAVAGDLNNWNPGESPMVRKGDAWEISLTLDPGAYQYQLVVDGEWMLDPANPVKVDNNIGGFNSSLVVTGGGADQSLTRMFATSYANGEFIVQLIAQPGEKFEQPVVYPFWENVLLFPNETENGWRIRLPKEAAHAGRSHLRVFSAHADGIFNDILIPLEKGAPVQDPALLRRQDHHAKRMYFAMVDRFVNGDSLNDAPVPDDRIHPKANYYGGDLAGVRQELSAGWFDSLHVNTIWLSPVVQNPEGAYQEWPAPRRWFSGYHGYWPVRSTVVDHRFGDAQTLQGLVDDAHARDFNVLLDFVANHVHQEHPVMAAHPDWATRLDLGDGTKNIRIWDEQRLTTWFDDFLPSLDFSQAAVRQFQADSAMFWLETYGLDGFRHDATKHIPTNFWRELSLKMKQKAFDSGTGMPFQIGETFGSRELIGSYVGPGLLHAQFDFNLYWDMRSMIALADPEGAERFRRSLAASLTQYGHHHLMGNITGNHDMPRFIAYASGDLGFAEDPKEAGFTRDIRVTNPIGYQRLSQLTALMSAVPGIPILYYGDEIGITGAGDPDNRRMWRRPASAEEQAVLATCRSLMAVRARHMAAMYGETVMETDPSGAFYLLRYYLGETLVYAFNPTQEAVKLNIQPSLPLDWGLERLQPVFGHQWEAGVLELEPSGFEVLR